jgi:multiple sugar transport system permease protein
VAGRAPRWRNNDEPQPFLAFVLNSPAILLLCVLVFYPIVYSAWLSLHEYNLRRPRKFEFIGLGNYIEIFGTPQFWSAAGTTLVFSLASICLTLLLGLLLALLLNERFPGRGVLRAVTLIPWAIPPVVNGLVWQWMFQGDNGLINHILVSLGIIDTYQAWLSQPATALPALIVAEVWNHVPFVTVVILAALQTIPAELYDASKIDGANVFQRFWSVTFPWLSHSLLLVLITQTMVALRTFDIVYVLTGGGPGDSTTVIAWLTYVTTFSFTDFGKGNAYAYIIALVTLVLSIFYIRMLWKRGEMAR